MNATQARDVLVVGAGIAGLAAARRLAAAGLGVVVLDKGRGVGGRMATRREGDAVFDHGAQYFTARDPRFLAELAALRGAGRVATWCDAFPGDPPERVEPRWIGLPGMTAPAKALAEGLEVRTGATVAAARRAGDRWELVDAEGAVLAVGARLLLTAPVPQALDLLVAGGQGAWVDADVAAPLRRVRYRRSLALMAVLDGPSGLAAPGGLRIDDPACALTWIADNQAKGLSPVPAVTAHSGHGLAMELWDAPDDHKVAALSAALRPFLASRITAAKAHRWKFAHPVEPVGMPCLHDPAPGLAFAGDAFPGGRVEGAWASGVAAAEALLPA